MTGIEAMADEYSRRARRARVAQGKPPVISDAGVLRRLAELLAVGDKGREAEAS